VGVILEGVKFELFTSLAGECVKRLIISDLIDELPNHDLPFYFESKDSTFTDFSIILIARFESKCVALIVLEDKVFTGAVRSVFIRTLLVAERFHGSSIPYKMVCLAFQSHFDKEGRFPDCIAMKTYNPVAYHMMLKFSRNLGGKTLIYPNIGGQNDRGKVGIAELYAQNLHPLCKFNPNTGVISGGGGVISSSFWNKYPTCRNKSINEFFFRHVGDTDRVLSMVFCCTEIDKRYIMKNLRINAGREA
jgi:hypothetical protein